MKNLLTFLFIMISLNAFAQEKLWTDADRSFLVENLERTRNEMIKETEFLTAEQWHFKPSEDSWCIGQVLEHMGLYERIVKQEASIANALPPRPELFDKNRTDSLYLSWMGETDPHIAPTNAVPLGFMKGIDNLSFFLYGRELLIDYVSNTDRDLKAQFVLRGGEPNDHRSIHGLLVVHFAHTDRHLLQIARIKGDPYYPK